MEDTDSPLNYYIQPKEFAVGYNYWEEEVKHLFIDYPETFKITGVSYNDAFSMTIDDFLSLKELMVNHYKILKVVPDPMTSLLKDFRAFADIIIESIINDRKAR